MCQCERDRARRYEPLSIAARRDGRSFGARSYREIPRLSMLRGIASRRLHNLLPDLDRQAAADALRFEMIFLAEKRSKVLSAIL